MPLLPGIRLGPFEIISPLGAGGMGEVYRARDTRLGREVAVKVLPEEFASDLERLRRFEQEARAAAALNHPNILVLHDLGTHKGTLYIVTELLEGESLRQRLRAGPLTPAMAVEFGIQISQGLAAAHERGIVHRDLKPGNIFITQAGHAKILDFGLARLEKPPHTREKDPSEASTAEAPTNPGAILGTPGYMAPEQLRGQAADPRSDIFALGVILYEMLTGARPFRGASEADALAAILTTDPPPLSTSGKEAPSALKHAVLRCLAKDPDRRFQSARDVALELENLRVPGSPLASWRGRMSRLVGVAAGALLLVAMVSALIGWMGSRTRSDLVPANAARQITNLPGIVGNPCLSPDGHAVAFTVPNGRGSDILVSDIQGDSPIRIISNGAANTSPAWFPDGSALAFVSPRDGRPCVWKVSRFGGSATFLLENGASPAISPDGEKIAISRSENGGYDRIWIAPLDDPAKATRITGDNGGVWNHGNPSWSPDGRFICYNDQDDLWAVPATGGTARRLTSGGNSNSKPAWAPDGRHIYFAALLEATWAIWRVPSAGGALQRVTLGTGSERWPSLSANGKRLAYATTGRWTSCALLDRVTRERSLLTGGTFTGQASFSPHGDWMAFTMWWNGTSDIWKVRVRQAQPVGEPERLTDQQGRSCCVAYSPDGRWIAYHRVLRGERHIWVVPAEGGPPVAFTTGPSCDDTPQWSPDGREISFMSDRGGGDGIWAAPFSDGRCSGGARPLLRGAGSLGMHCWLPDGKRLAFTMGEGSDCDAWVLEAGGVLKPVRLTRGAGAIWLCPDPSSGDLLVLGTWGSTRAEVRRVSLAGGPPRGLADMPASQGGTDLGFFAVSGDGRLMVLIEKENEGNVWMLESTGGHF